MLRLKNRNKLVYIRKLRIWQLNKQGSKLKKKRRKLKRRKGSVWLVKGPRLMLV